MDIGVLNSVIDITSQRDMDSLENSLIATLVEMAPISQLSLVKNNPVTGEVTDLICLKVESHSASGDYTVSEITSQKKINELDGNDKNIASTITRKKDGTMEIIVPVVFSEVLQRKIIVESQEDISGYLSLIQSFVKIYENYLFILNESDHDQLTGLLNRRAFDRKVKSLVQDKKLYSPYSRASVTYSQKDKHRSYWLVVIDIDHFKKVNDKYGHLYGDEVLLKFSQLMGEYFSNTELLFRYGGEEFILILEGNDRGLIYDQIEGFRYFIESTAFPLVGQITVSIGYEEVKPRDYPPIKLELADKALYYVKNHGRNQVCNYAQLVAEGKLSTPHFHDGVDLF
ncbi:GGDEF domain-containing protein [Vibrio sp. Of7-15]|uniref:GGDEF domain-containing protein n=1 Tax=Vibrio sp. Of7-15 TaxID=2724879 RepID=UPI001EF2A792|nr:GGDEF domain-containing protein [Vibrio sp. Of7-15]MCG7499411.1 GGDEF domain-containing protein [Vibrio sp. Of7-15]